MEPSGVAVPATLHRFTKSTALVATLALVAACSPGASPSAPPAATPAGASTAPTVEPSEAAAPALFHIVGDAPVIERTIVPDRGAVLPGAVAVDADGTYHAWVIAFADTPGTQDLHHLTSDDAVTWTVQLDDSLEGLSEGFGNPGALPASVIQDGDDWVMYLTGTLASERAGWDIWRATAPGPDGPWTRGDEPVLRRGPAGAWDSGGLDFPSVIPLAEGGWAMFFSGIDPAHPEGGAVGRATSDDGIEWTKDDDDATTDARLAESDPVVEPGLCGGFDTRAVHQPRVLAAADNTVMAYAGYAGDNESRPQVGYADSLDEGATWGCEWPNPALNTATLPEGGIHTIVAFQRGDRLALLVEWLTNDGTDDWLAEFGMG